MTPTQARQWTLKELSDWCKEEQGKCEGADNWTVFQRHQNQIMPVGLQVILMEDWENDKPDILCYDYALKVKERIFKGCLENRKHLDTDRYFALQSVIDKCNELMNSISVAA